MAVTVTARSNSRDNMPEQDITGIRYAKASVAFDSSYPTGGEALAKTALGLPSSGATVLYATAVLSAGTATGFQTCEYDHANDLILLYQGSGAEAVNASDASAVIALVCVAYTE